jgi:PKD repeat protein
MKSAPSPVSILRLVVIGLALTGHALAQAPGAAPPPSPAATTAAPSVVAESKINTAGQARLEIVPDRRSARTGDQITFAANITGVQITAQVAATLQYQFAFGDGVMSDWSSSSKVTHSYADAGTYRATVAVRRNNADSRTAAAALTSQAVNMAIRPRLEVALEVTPLPAEAYADVNFTVRVSNADGPADYEVHFGDGQVGQRVPVGTATHQYRGEGSNYAYAVVRTSDATANSPRVLVEVQLPPLSSSLAADPAATRPGSDVRFTATVMHSNGAPVEYCFDYGDGDKCAWTTSNVAVHRYAQAAVYHASVQLRAFDRVWPAAMADVTVNQLIRLNVVPDVDTNHPMAGSELLISATADPELPGTEYRFTFGDGTATDWQSSNAMTHTYAASGRVQIRVDARAPGALPGAGQMNIMVGWSVLAIAATTMGGAVVLLSGVLLLRVRPVRPDPQPKPTLGDLRFEVREGTTSAQPQLLERNVVRGDIAIRLSNMSATHKVDDPQPAITEGTHT